MAGEKDSSIILLLEKPSGHTISEKKLLETLGYTVVCSEPEKGERKIATDDFQISLALLDIDSLNGKEAAKTAETIMKLGTVPVVYLYREKNVDGIKETEAVATYGYIEKNSNAAIIDIKIKNVLSLFNTHKLNAVTAPPVRNKAAGDATLEKEKFDTIINYMPVMLDAFDENGVTLFWNKECERVTGYTSEELVGNSNALEILVPDPVYRKQAMEKIASLGHYYRNAEFELVCKNGERKVISWSNVSRDYPIEGWWSWGIGQDVTELRQMERARENAIKEKEALLRELQHRIKNSFTLINSMLNLKKDSIEDSNSIAVIDELNKRINALSELYTLLYSSGNYNEIALDTYCMKLSKTFANFAETVTVKTDFDSLVVPVKTATSIGLIMTEFISNSFKHAFPDNRRGILSISLKTKKEEAVLEVADDGVGIPKGIDHNNSKTLGLQVVNALVKQLNGRLEIIFENGTKQMVYFKPAGRHDG